MHDETEEIRGQLVFDEEKRMHTTLYFQDMILWHYQLSPVFRLVVCGPTATGEQVCRERPIQYQFMEL